MCVCGFVASMKLIQQCDLVAILRSSLKLWIVATCSTSGSV